MPTTSPGAVSAAASERRATPKSISLARGSPASVTSDVLRLDVAVDDAAGVGVVERLAEVGADLADLAVAERARRGLSRARVVAVDQLGDQQRVAVLLADLVEGDDAGVVEARGGLRLAHDPPGLGAAGVDRLDRDRPLEAPVPGLVDNAEAAAADSALDQESISTREPTTALRPSPDRGALLPKTRPCCGS